MSHQEIREVPLHFGEADRLFGILTSPDKHGDGRHASRVFVFLSAGLLHRIGPHRLHVRLARELARSGISSLRVDLASIGDSSSRGAIAYRESVAEDFKEILSVLESHFGDVSIILAGLCSGADNAIRLTSENPQVVGLVLLDPVCPKDKGFGRRAFGFWVREYLGKCTRLSSYTRWLNRRISALTHQTISIDEQIDNLTLRDIPTTQQTRVAFEAIAHREGRVLSVFSEYALRYYNQVGQLGRVLDVKHYEHFCTETFWPQVQHTYPFDSQRRELIEEIISWSDYNTSATS